MARWLSYLAVVGLLCMVQWSCLVNGAPLPSPASNEPLPPPQSLEWGQYLDKPIPGQVILDTPLDPSL